MKQHIKEADPGSANGAYVLQKQLSAVMARSAAVQACGRRAATPPYYHKQHHICGRGA